MKPKIKFHKKIKSKFIIELLIIFLLSFLITFLVNFNNISELFIAVEEIEESQDLKNLDKNSNTELRLAITPNKTYTAVVENNFLYSTNEFGFDLLILSDFDPEGTNELLCRDITDKGNDILQKAKEQFNKAYEISGEDLEIETTQVEGTEGSFLDSTVLLECEAWEGDFKVINSVSVLLQFSAIFTGLFLVVMSVDTASEKKVKNRK